MQHPGLAWAKLDLHVHTPGSTEDYGDPTATADEIVARALEVGLQGIAITDHNTGEWVNRVKTAARDTPLIVFPGVEVTVSGGTRNVHILGIFDPSAGTEHIHDLLSKLYIGIDKRAKPIALAKGDVSGVIDQIHECGGIPILAHADSPSGVFGGMKGQARIAVVQNPHLLGAQLRDLSSAKFLDGTDPAYRRRLACIRASDSHAIVNIGSVWSAFKLGMPTLRSLRQCFVDSVTRIRFDDVPFGGYPRLISMEVSGGFFDSVPVSLHAGLNAFIGGKGVGKSLLIEFLRFALNQISDVQAIRTDCLGKLDKRLGKGSRVSVVCQMQSGAQYKIERVFGGDLDVNRSPITVTNLADGSSYTGEISALFQVLCYSQNEVIDISRDTNIQLNMIDRYIDLPAHESKLREIRRKVADNATAYIDCLLAKEAAAGLDRQIATKEERATEIERMLQDEHFVSNKQWKERAAAWADESGRVARFPLQVREAVESSRQSSLSGLAQTAEQFVELQNYRSAATEAMSNVVDAVERALIAFETDMAPQQGAYQKWLEDFAAWEAAFAAFLQTAGGEHEVLSAEQGKLTSELVTLRRQKAQIADKAASHDACLQERVQLLNELDESMNMLSEERLAVYSRLESQSQGKLRLQLMRSENRTAYLDELVDVCHGMYIQRERLRSLVDEFLPRELADVILARDYDKLSRPNLLTNDSSRKIIDGIHAQTDQLKKLLVIASHHAPYDVPAIQYRKEDGIYYPLDELSVGQKCTALLLIAFADGEAPILIDQPEDALDVTTVYQDVVQRLRSSKERRQFLVTTHNSNIAVTSDSDIFHVLKGGSTRGEILCSGPIDSEIVSREVLIHMEGGEEPYRLRGHYNLS